MNEPLLETDFPGLAKHRGKVRDIYQLTDPNNLLIVTTDRLSAFDVIQSSGIPDRGRVLNLLSKFWFDTLQQPHHCLSTDIDQIIQKLPATVLKKMDRESLAGRCMLVKKTRPALVEFVVRGYLEGSGWKEYQDNGTVCGIKLPPGLVHCAKLPEPIFSPATKAAQGKHDQNITFEITCEIVGTETAKDLRQRSLEIYKAGAELALSHGIIIADTKFEWGELDDKFILIDEVLTPDSSRFWPIATYGCGRSQISLDKQFIRGWLEEGGWDKNSPPPPMPEEIVIQTREKYIEAYERITEKTFSWK